MYQWKWQNEDIWKSAITLAKMVRINIFRMLKINWRLAAIQWALWLFNLLNSYSIPPPSLRPIVNYLKTNNPQSRWKAVVWQPLEGTEQKLLNPHFHKIIILLVWRFPGRSYLQACLYLSWPESKKVFP